uniref:Sodium channel blocker AbNaTx12 n=1 Tax=Androctonus bicolor TaxID=748906 RepID=A0A0K0LBV6_9SCOR|nr:sodium channel blocker AbNaTx12 [Androctonus bicolor]
MKLFLLTIISASMLIESLADGPGYLKKRDGCKSECLIGNDFCNNECRAISGSYGYCWAWGLACWCENLPEDRIWKYETNTCGGKK